MGVSKGGREGGREREGGKGGREGGREGGRKDHLFEQSKGIQEVLEVDPGLLSLRGHLLHLCQERLLGFLL